MPAIILPFPPRPVVKRCACCGRTFTLEEWKALPYKGDQETVDGPTLEVRDCPCRNTMVLEKEECKS